MERNDSSQSPFTRVEHGQVAPPRLPGWLGGLRFNLAEQRTWLAVLLAIFVLAGFCRLLAFADLSGHPAGQLQEWRDTDPWFYYQLGREMAEEGDHLLPGVLMLVEAGVSGQGEVWDWFRWSGQRLPRGGLILYLMSSSVSLGGGLALYKLLALLVGSAIPVFAAVAGEHLFRSRSVGAVAGVVTAAHQPLVLATLVPGPWMWEAALLAGLLAASLYTLRKPEALNGWMLAGLLLGLGFWLRPLFLWGFPLLALGLWQARVRPDALRLAALLAPALALALTLSARNHFVEGDRLPYVGQPAWDFATTVHSGAVLEALPPSDIGVYARARGSLHRVVRLTLKDPAERAALAPVLSRKLRELLGARDTATFFDPDYARRRSEVLRMATLAPDTLMAAGWAGLLFLAFRRRLPPLLAALLGIVVAHGLLFQTGAFDRLLLHVLGAFALSGGLVLAWAEARRHPGMPFVLLMIWAAVHFGLQVDDQARGPRFRASEFERAAWMLRQEGHERRADLELEDWRRQRHRDAVLREFWIRGG